MAALASYPSDSLLAELLEDDRVVPRLQFLQDVVQDELEWLSQLPSAVWRYKGEWCPGEDIGGGDLRNEVMSAAHTSGALLEHRVWSVARSPPWSLAQGDIGRNLHDLKSVVEPPSEPSSKKIWELLHMGFSASQLEEGVRLLSGISWSSTSVEQQHGSASVLAKAHRRYGAGTVTARSMLHRMGQFFVPTEKDKYQLSVLRRIEVLASKRPAKCGAKQQFLKELSASLGETIGQVGASSGRTGQSVKELQQALVAKHSARFLQAPEAVQKGLRQRVVATAPAGESEAATDLEHAQAALALHADREVVAADSVTGNRPQLLLSVCRWAKRRSPSWTTCFCTANSVQSKWQVCGRGHWTPQRRPHLQGSRS